MAKVLDNIFVRGLSGKLGDQVVFRTLRDGRTIVCNKPDFSKRKLSKDQKEHHRRFKEAAAYARSASRSQPIYAQLAEGTMKNAYNWWEYVPTADGKVIVEARDLAGNKVQEELADSA